MFAVGQCLHLADCVRGAVGLAAGVHATARRAGARVVLVAVGTLIVARSYGTSNANYCRNKNKLKTHGENPFVPCADVFGLLNAPHRHTKRKL